MKTVKTLSEKRINRLRAQGFTGESEQKLSDKAFGIRFAYRACVSILTVAVFTQSVPLFSVMLGIAFLGIVLPKHPFDYVYNYTLSRRLNKPQLSARSRQLKFACTIATAWIASVILLMLNGMNTAGTLMAIALILVALLPSTTDFCLPSVIYNALFLTKNRKAEFQSN